MKISIRPEDCKFHIDEENRKVVCIIENTQWKLNQFLDDNNDAYLYWRAFDVQMPNRFIGIATCTPEDEWNEAFGRRLAYIRAKRSFYNEFFNAANKYINNIDSHLNKLIDSLNAFGKKISINYNKDERYVKTYLDKKEQ